MSLEPRSGHKLLLKLLLDKTFDSITQAEINKKAIDDMTREQKKNEKTLKLILKQLELITGEEHYG